MGRLWKFWTDHHHLDDSLTGSLQLKDDEDDVGGRQAAMNGFLPPYIIPGYEPGTSVEDRNAIGDALKWQRRGQQGQESCIVKTTLSGAMGLGLGAFFSLMSSSFTYEDPLRRNPNFDAMPFKGKASIMFRDMGRGMWTTGKGFGKVGALYSGLECCVEGYRAKNDLTNSVVAGGLAGAVLARASGLKAMALGAAGFAVFSGAIDAYMRKEAPDED